MSDVSALDVALTSPAGAEGLLAVAESSLAVAESSLAVALTSPASALTSLAGALTSLVSDTLFFVVSKLNSDEIKPKPLTTASALFRRVLTERF